MTRRNWTVVVAALLTSAVAFGLWAFRKEIQRLRLRSEAIAGIGTVLETPRAVPEFRLEDSAGGAFDRSKLIGKVSVVDFMYTRCPDVCPAMTARLALLQERIAASERLRPYVRLVSVSVDTEHDSGEVLMKYAGRSGAVPAIWSFLRGRAADIQSLAASGFSLTAIPSSAPAPAPASADATAGAAAGTPQGDGASRDAAPSGTVTSTADPGIAHSDRFSVVDARAQVRAYFAPPRSGPELDALVAYIERLVAEGARSGDLDGSPESGSGS
jgi:cytochrome oxidase Cu insertion factor (SCO1/SenC/PrrC family)